MGAGLSCFLWSGDGYVGELLELQQGCEGPFGSSRGYVWLVSRCLSGSGPNVAWNGEAPGYSRVSAGALELLRGFRDSLWWPQEGQSPCELLGGLSGFHSHRCRGLRPCVESVLEPDDSSPVLTWIFGYFCSLPRGVSPCLEWGMHVRFPPEL